MFERYTEKARRAIFFARAEASRCGVRTIDPQHLLVGVLMDMSPALAESLPAGAAEALIARISATPQTPAQALPLDTDIQLSHESKRALAHGAEEADRLHRREIDSEHLLLGLLREDEWVGRLLADFTIDRAVLLRNHPHASERQLPTREQLHALVDSLPEAAFEPAKNALTHMQVWPPPPSPEPPQIVAMRERMRARMPGHPGPRGGMRGMAGGGGGSYSLSSSGKVQNGRFSSGGLTEDGSPITETAIVHQGHEITLLEQIRLSADRKTLSYKIEVSGPGQQRNMDIDFKVE